MPLLSNRAGRVSATQNADGDGGVTSRDETVAGPATGRAQVDERLAAQRRLAERTAAAQAATTGTATRSGDAAVLAPAGPRPRSSFWATLALVSGIGAMLTVFTGVLAGPGVALGLVAAFLGVAGISATGNRHVVGKAHSVVGIALGLGSIVLGTLALTGMLSWLDASTNEVTRLHHWLATHVSWLFPTR